MKPWFCATLVVMLCASIAEAQPEPPAAPGKPLPMQPKAPPLPTPDAQKGLPPGHPPITGQGQGQPKTPESQREMLERLRELRQRAQDQAKRVDGKGVPAQPQQPRYPRDEHGHCLGQGPNDRPADINLLHGWLGVNNESAVIPPRPKGTWDWWKWRLTPYPFRYENHSDECDPRNQPVPLVANVVNLGVLVFLLVRFGRKPVREALVKRRDRIMAEIDRAREIRKSAKARLVRYEEELDHLDERLAALRDQYQMEGEAEEKRLLAELSETRERMLGDADFRIAQESKQARDELSREAMDSALSAAEELLTTTMTPDDHERLCDDYLEQVGTALRGKTVFGRGGAT